MNENAPEEHLKRPDLDTSLVIMQALESDATTYGRPVYNGKERINASVNSISLWNLT